MKKFVASITEVNKDTDILVEDIVSMGTEGLVFFANEALDRGDENEVFVVSDDSVMAENVATALNLQFEKEMELMSQFKDAKDEVKKVVDGVMGEATTEEVSTEAKIAQSDAARKFLAKHGGDMVNAKKAPAKEETKSEDTQKEEKEMNSTNTRRRLSTGGAQSNENKQNQGGSNMNTENKGQSQGQSRRRLSTGTTAGSTAPRGTRRRLGRSESINSSYKRFEGPWYLNAGQYEVLNRLDQILVDMKDEELGISNIALVEPTDIRRYERRTDIQVVIQVKANGSILEFPIKESNSNSKADLQSSSIGWVEYGGKVRPSFGFWRPNALQVKATCACGNEFTASTTNMYCRKCTTRHADVEVSAEHTLAFEFDGGVVFQTVPNLVVPRDILALVMAIAQYDAGFDMHGVVSE